MKKIRKYRNKGFTLVECVIAIAVFAIMTTMVIMIMGMTTQTAKKASDSEEDLNGLVQNVVQDQTVKKKGADSKTLMMKVGSDSFSMTYSTVDGNKNFVECPSCHDIFSNLDYMENVRAAYESGTGGHRISYYFDPTTVPWLCPSCGHTFTDYTLECQACMASGSTKNAALFRYDRETGGFTCETCGSGNVGQQGVKEKITADSAMSVSGINANAIRYAAIKQLDSEKAKDLIKLDGTSGSMRVQITYTPSSVPLKPGTYKLKVDSLSIDNADVAGITLTLPGCYVCNKTSNSSSVDGGSGHGYVKVTTSKRIENPEETSSLYVGNITRTGATGSGFEVEFQLTNYYNNVSFETDFEEEGGLWKWWFQKTAGSAAVISNA